jgi:ribosome maturation protein SDO1
VESGSRFGLRIQYHEGQILTSNRSHVIRIKFKNGGMECKLESYTRADGIDSFSEKDLDEVLQIGNVFVNVSKGEVASAEDLKKAFGKANSSTIIQEVGIFINYANHLTR